MEALKRRIMAEGKNLGRGILKTDSFINHQIDTHLMFEVGRELARHFAAVGVTKSSRLKFPASPRRWRRRTRWACHSSTPARPGRSQ